MPTEEFVTRFRFVVSDETLESNGYTIDWVVKELGIRSNDISVKEIEPPEIRGPSEMVCFAIVEHNEGLPEDESALSAAEKLEEMLKDDLDIEGDVKSV